MTIKFQKSCLSSWNQVPLENLVQKLVTFPLEKISATVVSSLRPWKMLKNTKRMTIPPRNPTSAVYAQLAKLKAWWVGFAGDMWEQSMRRDVSTCAAKMVALMAMKMNSKYWYTWMTSIRRNFQIWTCWGVICVIRFFHKRNPKKAQGKWSLCAQEHGWEEKVCLWPDESKWESMYNVLCVRKSSQST